MDRKIVILILSFALFGSFFMPLFEWHSFEMSGLNYILSTHIPSYKYFLILIPLSSLFLFLGALYDGNYFFSRKLLSRIPLVTLIFVFIIRCINENSENRFTDNDDIFSTIDLGFWLVLSFSLLLVFVESKRKEKNELQFF